MNTALSDFSHLTPDHVIDVVEQSLGCRCTNMCRQLNSYINRVYEVEREDGDWVIAKFYRPGRWSPEAIRDELDFLHELAAGELPVIAPLVKQNGGLLQDGNGMCFTLFPKRGGRPLVEPVPERLEELGRLLGRIHEIGSRHNTRDRILFTPEEASADHLELILEADFPYDRLRDEYADTADELIDTIAPLFDQTDLIRIHGDLHAQNLLDRPGEPLHIIDFDDMAEGPAVQDIWMLLPDRPENSRRELDRILDGYSTFREFDYRELRLVEPLRAMRYIHYTAWCARQEQDGGFSRLSPDWGTESFWKREIDDLKKQLALIHRGGGAD